MQYLFGSKIKSNYIYIKIMNKIFICLFTLFLLLSCSSDKLITNVIAEPNKEILISSFEFNFPESKSISTKSIIDSGKNHFFYFFSPT